MTSQMLSADPASARPCDPLAPAVPDSAARARLAELAARAKTGIDASSGLASDFLNQFNEVSMLLDMSAGDVELLDELADWKPRGYVAHFEASNFSDTALVLEAYALSPQDTRRRFDALAAELGTAIAEGLAALGALAGDRAAVGAASQALAAEVRARIDALSAIIHPVETIASNDDISALFAERR